MYKIVHNQLIHVTNLGDIRRWRTELI